MPLNWNFPAKIGPANREQVSGIKDDDTVLVSLSDRRVADVIKKKPTD
jgi:hypothetical protein